MVQLIYKCRLCGQELRLVAESLDGLDRATFDEYLRFEMPQEVVHECTQSGAQRGICKLVGSVVTANEGGESEAGK